MIRSAPPPPPPPPRGIKSKLFLLTFIINVPLITMTLDYLMILDKNLFMKISIEEDIEKLNYVVRLLDS